MCQERSKRRECLTKNNIWTKKRKQFVECFKFKLMIESSSMLNTLLSFKIFKLYPISSFYHKILNLGCIQKWWECLPSTFLRVHQNLASFLTKGLLHRTPKKFICFFVYKPRIPSSQHLSHETIKCIHEREIITTFDE